MELGDLLLSRPSSHRHPVIPSEVIGFVGYVFGGPDTEPQQVFGCLSLGQIQFAILISFCCPENQPSDPTEFIDPKARVWNLIFSPIIVEVENDYTPEV